MGICSGKEEKEMPNQLSLGRVAYTREVFAEQATIGLVDLDEESEKLLSVVVRDNDTKKKQLKY